MKRLPLTIQRSKHFAFEDMKSSEYSCILGTPNDLRRESVRSSFSLMKSKFLGGQLRSSSSIDKAIKVHKYMS